MRINTKQGSAYVPGFHPIILLRTWLYARRMAKRLAEATPEDYERMKAQIMAAYEGQDVTVTITRTEPS